MGFLWDLLQEQNLAEITERMDRLQHEDAPGAVRELAEVSLELRLRQSALIRLLIARGLFTAEEYAAQLAKLRAEEGKSG